MTNRAHVYMLCGLPFAGKTTLAQALVRHRGFVHLEVDAITRELGCLPGQEVSEEQWEAAFAVSYRRVAELVQQGQPVVYDATNFDRAARDRVRAVAARAHCPATVIYASLPVAEAQRRRQANRQHGQRHNVSDESFAEVMAGFEVPTADEAVLTYDATEPPIVWIERNL